MTEAYMAHLFDHALVDNMFSTLSHLAVVTDCVHRSVAVCHEISSVVVKDLRLKDKDKDLMSKDEDKDEESSFKDKDKDFMSKDKDKDLSFEDKDKDLHRH